MIHKCPNCHQELGTPPAVRSTLRPGDLMVCICCGEILALNQQLNAHPLDDFGWDSLPPQAKVELNRIKANIVRLHKTIIRIDDTRFVKPNGDALAMPVTRQYLASDTPEQADAAMRAAGGVRFESIEPRRKARKKTTK